MTREKILVVEDEKDILNLIGYHLEREGYEAVRVESGEAALSALRSDRPDLIVLDLMLPGMDGLDVCRAVRADQSLRDVPILILTAKSEDSDIVAGLEIGADDYLTKPFSPKVMVARIRAILRRIEKRKQHGTVSRILIHDIEIDIAKHEVTCAGRPVHLSVSEFMILEFLARNPGWVFSRSRIISAVKGEDYPVTERSVDVQILGLRKKLGEQGSCIQTVRGIGYKMLEA
jgi:two-component system, OmpR family, alkaline phosphatase synthesis response regulator PhoP